MQIMKCYDSSREKINPFSPADHTNLFAISVDRDDMAHNEPSHQELLCFLFVLTSD